MKMFEYKKSIKRKTALFIMLAVLFLFINVNNVLAAETQGVPSLGANIALSGVGWAVATVVGFIAMIITSAVGSLVTLMVQILVSVTQFNNFINVPTVVKGWVIIRDLCNMLFILILLVVAFATILRIESYQWKKILPKLLIMAVLINFSRTIFGLLIDFSQVVMLTFVNAFSSGGQFIDALQVKNWYTFTNDQAKTFTNAADQWSIVLSMVMGVIAAIVTLIVMVVMVAVFVMRVIMLWIYTIFSPIIFLGFAVPAIQKYTSKIWEDFTKELIVGPVLAFFIWLALITVQESPTSLYGQVLGGGSQTLCSGLTAFFCDVNLTRFIITVGLLLGGLMAAQQFGGAAGSMAGKALDWAKKTPKLLGGGALVVGSWAARKFAASKHGFEIRPAKVIAGFRETLAEKKRKEDIKIEQKSAAMLKEGKLIRGGLGASRDFSEAAAKGFLWNRMWKMSSEPDKMGVMQSTWKAGNVKKNIEKLEKEKADEKTTEARRQEIDKEIPKLRDEMGKYQTPQTFYAQQKSLTAYQEAAKKSGLKDNEDEIIETFDKAMGNGDIELAVGMILHSAEVSHGNEMIQKHKALDDVWDDDHKKILIKKGDFFDQSNAGMRGFFQQYVHGKEGLGLSEQETYSIQSQFSSRAKAVGHMNLSESVGKKNDLFYQRSDREQTARAHTESMKWDIETLLRKLNRIGWGNEVQYEDYDDLDKDGSPKIKRRFVANDLTVKDFIKTAPTLDLEVNDRKRLNPNAAENFFVNYMLHQLDPDKFEESLVEIMEKLGTSYTAKSGDSITHKQLAMEATAFGGDKYIANLHMEKVDLEASGASPEEIKKIDEKITKAESILNNLKDNLKGPGMVRRSTSSKEGGEKSNSEGVKPGKMSAYIEKKRSK